MRPASSPSFSSSDWRTPSYSGLYFDSFAADSAWIRDRGCLRIPASEGVQQLMLHGEFRPHPEARGVEVSPPALECRLDGKLVAAFPNLKPGPFDFTIPLTPEAARRGVTITLDLGGTSLTNALAWLGRVTGWGPWQRFRAQNKNRQLRIATLTTDTGEAIFDFSVRLAPFSLAFARRHARHEFNLVGFLTADLGVGESARCMVRAADAANLTTALVPLKLYCKNRLGDQTYAPRLQEQNPFRVNVIHIDAPVRLHGFTRIFQPGCHGHKHDKWH